MLHKGNLIKKNLTESIIGREKYISKLNQFLDSSKSGLGIIFGRRRVGKTFTTDLVIKNYLFKHNDENSFYLYFTGSLNKERKIIIKHIFDSFKIQIKQSLLLDNFVNENVELFNEQNWGNFFLLLKLLHIELVNKFENTKLIIMFDEVPWLDGKGNYVFNDGFKHNCAYFWNDYAERNTNPIKILLTGSATTWMVDNIVNDKGGFYGRFTDSFEMKPFTLEENLSYLKHYVNPYIDSREAILYYMAFGGIPYYLSLIQKSNLSFEENVRKIFNSNLFRNEYQNLFKSLFKNYLKKDDFLVHQFIVELLAERKSVGYSIVDLISLLKERYNVSEKTTRMAVRDLLLSDFLKSTDFYIRNSKNKGKHNKIYYLNDCFCFFYIKWIKENNLNSLNANSHSFKVWAGFAFELVCFNQIELIKFKAGMSEVPTSEFYWNEGLRKNNSVKTQNKVQIDLLLQRKDISKIYILEAKFYDSLKYKIDKKEIVKLEKRANELNNYLIKSNEKYKIEYIFVTLNGIEFVENDSLIVNSENSKNIIIS